MKKLILLSFLSTLFFCTAEGKKIDGKIIFNNDSVINVTFNIPEYLVTKSIKFERLQNQIKYFDSNGTKKKVIPGIAKEIQFTYEDENVRMMAKYYNHQVIFLKLVVDGNTKLYKYYFTQSSPGIYNTSTGGMDGGHFSAGEMDLLQKGDEELKRFKRLKFKKEMCEYFKNCPMLVKKIEKYEFRINDMEAIVRFYNSRCK